MMTAPQFASATAPHPLEYLIHHQGPAAAGVVPGVDYAWSKPSVAALKAAGEVFVAQYFSADPSKNLTPARSADLQAAGIEIVAVWEYTAQAARGGYVQGQRDASGAEAQAKACGVDGIPVYWAVDYDAPPEDQPLIDGYSDGWASVLGDDRGRNPYGGYWPLSRLRKAGKATRLWGTPAWSGNQWATSGLVPDIMQGAVVTIGGVACDLDAGLSTDFGQWPRPAGPQHTWQWQVTDGHLSLAGVCRELTRGGAPGMTPAHVLRATCAKNAGHWDPVTYAWLNTVLGDPAASGHTPIPAGARLWVLAP